MYTWTRCVTVFAFPAFVGGGCVRVSRWMARGFSWLSGAALAALFAVAAHAASIGVSPTLLEAKAGESVLGLKVRNGDAAKSVSVQARVVRWRQDETGEVYTPADGVVASPPVTRILPRSENLIRIVRTATHPLAGEESYRLLVDELPDPDGQAAGTVSMLIRHSVPVFFSRPDAASAQPQWRIARVSADEREAGSGGWRVTVDNTGDKRLRLANLVLFDANGVRVGERQGLVGYVLGRSRREFVVTVVAADGVQRALNATALRLSVQGEVGLLETELLPVVSP